jgi:hypothetical protein
MGDILGRCCPAKTQWCGVCGVHVCVGGGLPLRCMACDVHFSTPTRTPCIRGAVAGGVDSGKSTLVAVLTHGSKGAPALDNGRGAARMNVFKHKHEIESGRTSSISQMLLAYDAVGRVINYASFAVLMPSELVQNAACVAQFIDLGGHQKFSKTALYGMACMLPDYVMLCICAVTGAEQAGTGAGAGAGAGEGGTEVLQFWQRLSCCTRHLARGLGAASSECCRQSWCMSSCTCVLVCRYVADHTRAPGGGHCAGGPHLRGAFQVRLGCCWGHASHCGGAEVSNRAPKHTHTPARARTCIRYEMGRVPCMCGRRV